MVKRIWLLLLYLVCFFLSGCNAIIKNTPSYPPPFFPSKTPITMNAFLTDTIIPKQKNKTKVMNNVINNTKKTQSINSTKNNHVINVALLIPLSGILQQTGQQILQGASTALFAYKNHNIHLIPLDTMGTINGAKNAMHQAINQQADVILGPLLASNTQAIIPMALAKKISVISFSNSSQLKESNIFIAGITLEAQAYSLMKFAKQSVHSIVVLAPNNKYGHVAVNALQKAAFNQKIEIKKIIFFEKNAYDFSSQIKSITNITNDSKKTNEKHTTINYQAIVIATTRKTTLQIIASQLAYYDTGEPNIQLYGLQSWESFKQLSLEPSLIGAKFITIPQQNNTFEKQYKNLYQKNPQTQAILAYDLMSMIITIAQHSPLHGSTMFSAEQLTSMSQGFQGIFGIFRFLKNGQIERDFSIAEITHNGIKIIQKAKNCFLCANTR